MAGSFELVIFSEYLRISRASKTSVDPRVNKIFCSSSAPLGLASRLKGRRFGHDDQKVSGHANQR